MSNAVGLMYEDALRKAQTENEQLKKEIAEIITAKELSEHIGDLKITSRQREFVKAAFRAMVAAVLQKRHGAAVSIYAKQSEH